MVVGTKAQVFHGTADRTAGGLVKSNLFQDKEDGRIKSKAQSKAGKQNPALKAWRSALEQAGGLQEDKKFKPIKKGSVLYKKAKKIILQMKTNFLFLIIIHLFDGSSQRPVTHRGGPEGIHESGK